MLASRTPLASYHQVAKTTAMLLLLLLPQHLFAAKYFISPTGNDENNGLSWSTPFASWAHATTVANENSGLDTLIGEAGGSWITTVLSFSDSIAIYPARYGSTTVATSPCTLITDSLSNHSLIRLDAPTIAGHFEGVVMEGLGIANHGLKITSGTQVTFSRSKVSNCTWGFTSESPSTVLRVEGCETVGGASGYVANLGGRIEVSNSRAVGASLYGFYSYGSGSVMIVDNGLVRQSSRAVFCRNDAAVYMTDSRLEECGEGVVFRNGNPGIALERVLISDCTTGVRGIETVSEDTLRVRNLTIAGCEDAVLLDPGCGISFEAVNCIVAASERGFTNFGNGTLTPSCTLFHQVTQDTSNVVDGGRLFHGNPFFLGTGANRWRPSFAFPHSYRGDDNLPLGALWPAGSLTSSWGRSGWWMQPFQQSGWNR